MLKNETQKTLKTVKDLFKKGPNGPVPGFRCSQSRCDQFLMILPSPGWMVERGFSFLLCTEQFLISSLSHLSRWPMGSGRDAVCTVLWTCSQGESTDDAFTVRVFLQRQMSVCFPGSVFSRGLLSPDLIGLISSSPVQKQTEDAFRHPAPDRRTTEQPQSV